MKQSYIVEIYDYFTHSWQRVGEMLGDLDYDAALTLAYRWLDNGWAVRVLPVGDVK